jgi:Flp pilus assembly protein TadD
VLGLLDSEQGRQAAARAQLLRARKLNPREPAIAAALARLAGGHPLTLAEAQEMLAQHITTPPA